MGLLSSPSQLNFSILLYGSLKKKKKKGDSSFEIKNTKPTVNL